MKGYTFRALPTSPVRYSDELRPAWLAQLRREGQRHWTTIRNSYGPIVYTTPEYATEAARRAVGQ